MLFIIDIMLHANSFLFHMFSIATDTDLGAVKMGIKLIGLI